MLFSYRKDNLSKDIRIPGVIRLDWHRRDGTPLLLTRPCRFTGDPAGGRRAICS